MSIRKIIQIDEDLCDGCGACVPSCAEGAIQIIDGKARLVGDNLCDGLGACLGECPQDALKVIERDAEDFDEAAVAEQVRPAPQAQPHHGGGCPSARVIQFTAGPEAAPQAKTAPGASGLGHWPIKLKLIPPSAPFLKGKDLILAADCTAFAYADLNSGELPGKALIIGCPKFDEPQADLAKLTAILRDGQVRSLTVIYMEVPCCHGYVYLARQALTESGRDIPFKRMELTLDGKVKAESQQSILGW